MTRNRVNLTLADGDYKRLLQAAAADGKLPSAFAADVLKAFLLYQGFPGSLEPSHQVPPAPLDRSEAAQAQDQGDESQIETELFPGVPERLKNRAERRQEAKKKRK